MPKVKGSNTRLYIGGDLLAHSDDVTINLDTDIEEVTDADSGDFAENMPTLNRASVDVSVWYSNTAAGVGLEDLLDVWRNQTELTLVAQIEAGVDIAGQGYLTNLSIQGGTAGGYIKFTAGFIGTGDWS